MSYDRPDQECRVACIFCEFLDKCVEQNITNAVEAKNSHKGLQPALRDSKED